MIVILSQSQTLKTKPQKKMSSPSSIPLKWRLGEWPDFAGSTEEERFELVRGQISYVFLKLLAMLGPDLLHCSLLIIVVAAGGPQKHKANKNSIHDQAVSSRNTDPKDASDPPKDAPGLF